MYVGFILSAGFAEERNLVQHRMQIPGENAVDGEENVRPIMLLLLTCLLFFAVMMALCLSNVLYHVWIA